MRQWCRISRAVWPLRDSRGPVCNADIQLCVGDTVTDQLIVDTDSQLHECRHTMLLRRLLGNVTDAMRWRHVRCHGYEQAHLRPMACGQCACSSESISSFFPSQLSLRCQMGFSCDGPVDLSQFLRFASYCRRTRHIKRVSGQKVTSAVVFLRIVCFILADSLLRLRYTVCLRKKLQPYAFRDEIAKYKPI